MSFLFAHEFGRAFIPKAIRPGLRRYLLKAGITEEPYSFFGYMFHISIAVALSIFVLFVLPIIKQLKGTMSQAKYMAVFGFGVFISLTLLFIFFCGLIILLIYFVLDLRIFNRTRKLEEIIPDFFEVVSFNLKAGFSFERSLWMAIKPQFGILSNEITIAAKKVMTGHDIDDALREFAYKYDSPMLKRSVDLIISELKEGGKISEIMGKIALDLKKTHELKEEMNASVLAYVIFISAIVMVISPVLFALSLSLLEVIQSIMTLLASSMGDSTSSFGMTFSKVSLNPKDFVMFSHICLIVIAIFAAMIVSIIEKGSIRSGVKYIPIYIIVSQVIYIISTSVLGAVFAGLKFA